MPRILFCNWASPFNERQRGGGVSIYQDNCIQSFVNEGWVVHALSSGVSYDLLGGEIRVAKLDLGDTRVSAFDMVNATTPAPGSEFIFVDQLSDRARDGVATVLRSFLAEHGPYDVVHFNNIEGFPALALPQVRRYLPGAVFVLTLHNFYPFCPQVYLWKDDSHSCDDKQGGAACLPCLMSNKEVARTKNVRRTLSRDVIANRLSGLGLRRDSVLHRGVMKAGRLAGVDGLFAMLRRIRGSAFPFERVAASQAEWQSYFMRRANELPTALNDTFDRILCVSERVRIIAEANGIHRDRLSVNYIGTKLYNARLTHKQYAASDKPLHIAYLGYANKVKGFYFLLEALEHAPPILLQRLSVTIAAQGIDDMAKSRLAALEKRMAALVVRAGYKHADLPKMLEGVDLGIVPVVWEDPLPQVAIEMVCNGVPILTSHLGGAREIANDPTFEFIAGDRGSFLHVLEGIERDRSKLVSFWSNDLTLRSMEDHIGELMRFYGQKGLCSVNKNLENATF